MGLAAAAAAARLHKRAGMGDGVAGGCRRLLYSRGNGGSGGSDIGILLPILFAAAAAAAQKNLTPTLAIVARRLRSRAPRQPHKALHAKARGKDEDI